MDERLLKMTAYLICQFLLVLLTPVVLLLTSINALLRQLLKAIEQASLEKASLVKPVHIHYELHQHVHLEQSTTFHKTLEQASRHLPTPLQILPPPKVQAVPVRTSTPSIYQMPASQHQRSGRKAS